MTIVFILFVLLGLAFHFLATWPTPAYAKRIAWGCWLAAGIVWAIPHVH